MILLLSKKGLTQTGETFAATHHASPKDHPLLAVKEVHHFSKKLSPPALLPKLLEKR
jgi:hypothetical protein